MGLPQAGQQLEGGDAGVSSSRGMQPSAPYIWLSRSHGDLSHKATARFSSTHSHPLTGEGLLPPALLRRYQNSSTSMGTGQHNSFIFKGCTLEKD